MRIKIGNKYIDAFLVLALVGTYALLKIYRNSINYADTAQGGIWNYLLLVLVGYGIVSMFFIRNVRATNSVRVAILYALIVWLNGILTFSITSVSSAYYFLVAPCFAPVMCAMYNACAEDVPRRTKKMWYVCWIIILALLFYTYVKYFGQYKYYESGDKIALNNSYYAACAIPFFLRRKDKLGLALTAFSVVIVFISNKRAGLIAVALALGVYYLINAKISTSSTKAIKRLLIGVATCLVLYLCFLFIDSKFQLNIFSRLNQLFNDGGSGRMEIYKYVFEEIKRSNPLEVLIGHGVSSINGLSMSLSSAHSDFLNIFYEYGLVAVLCFIAFYISLFATMRKMIRNGYENSASFGFSIVVSVFFSLFSANLDNQSFSIVLAVYWAVEIASWERTLYRGVNQIEKA